MNNYKKVQRVLLVILFVNFGVAILKIILGIAMDSASTIADGYHSIGDGTSNIIGIIGIELAKKPGDREHPYGHDKFEVIAGLFIGAMLLFLSGKIILGAIESFKSPTITYIAIENLIILLITVFINIVLSSYEYRVGKKLNSYILMSDSLHTRSDIFVSIGVLVTLLGVKLGLPPIIDPIASLIVACFIIHAAYEISISTIGVLVDKAVVDDKDIIDILNSFEEIKCYHNIRSRGSKTNIYIDMHVMVDPKMTVEEAHTLSHTIEKKVRMLINENTQVICHIEPYYRKNIL